LFDNNKLLNLAMLEKKQYNINYSTIIVYYILFLAVSQMAGKFKNLKMFRVTSHILLLWAFEVQYNGNGYLDIIQNFKR